VGRVRGSPTRASISGSGRPRARTGCARSRRRAGSRAPSTGWRARSGQARQRRARRRDPRRGESPPGSAEPTDPPGTWRQGDGRNPVHAKL